jgi:LPS export ABC transporter protein LptC
MKAKAALAIFVFFFFFAAGFLPVNAQPSSEQQPQQQMSDFSLSGFGDQGKKSWDLAGKSADIGAEVIKLKSITGNFYGEKENVLLSAVRGDFNRSVGNIHLEENVVVKSTSGAVLTTDSLDWDREKQLVSTHAPVKLERMDVIITGTGAKGFPDLNKVTLEKNVTVNIKTQSKGKAEAEKKNIFIFCDGPMRVDYQKNIATFNNNVRVKTEDGDIESDLMDVYFINTGGSPAGSGLDDIASMGKSNISKIFAQGNVKITRESNVAYCYEAEYSALEHRITLQGNPRLVIYSTEQARAPFRN